MGGMEFGVFDHMDRGQGTLGDLYESRLKLAEEYDRAGFYGYHVAEHHATPLGVAPSPSVFLSAVAQRTKRLRFGPLVYLLPMYHPIRLIDEICMLDQMSGGRFMLGIGRGISPVEVGLWGLDPDAAPAMYAEALEVILRGLATNELTFEGKYYRFDRMPMELEPVQRPHPPLWYGVARPEAVDWCAEHDVNIVTNLPPGPMRAVTDRYRAVWAAQGKSAATLPKMAGTRHVVVAGTDAEALDVARRGYPKWRQSFLKLWIDRSTLLPSPAAIPPETFDELQASGRGIAGSPGTVRDFLRQAMEEGGLNYLLCRFAFGDLAPAESLQSVKLFANEIMPAFAGPEPGSASS
jgi:alkanesulfonate monooxygenase SsuD/methylene tetrahydromethanopterin reductase-like flavin-dependent oxidoreductase (luciferase family)